MADDTAALVVALSAQVTKFDKDLKQAVGIADKRTKEIETNFSKLNQSITNQLSTLATGFTSRLGGLGTALSRLGPAGIASGVGIAAAAFAMVQLVQSTERYVEELGRLKDAGETIGITATQLKALERVGREVGLSGEEIGQFLTRFVANMEQLKSGSGPLFDALQKIDIELVKQFNAAKTTSEQIDVLAKAYSRLNTESERVTLTRAAGGRAGATFGRLLTELQQRGGVPGVTAAIPNIDKAAKDLDEISDKLEQIKRDTVDIWGRMFAPEILAALTFIAEKAKLLAESVESVINSVRSVPQITVNKTEVNVPLPPARPAAAIEARLTNEQELARLRVFIGLAGDAAKVTEQLALKVREINQAKADGKITDEQANRALAAANLAAKVSIEQARERLGIATETQIAEARLAQLRQDQERFQLSAIETQKAEIIILREAKEVADALTVRQSYLPGLTQLAVDISRIDKEMDKFATTSLNQLTNSLADVVTGVKTVKEAFADMIKFVANELAKLAIRQGVIGPLASALGGSGIGVPGLQHGTINWGGGWTWVGEKGPELVNLPKGSQVVPNEVVRGGVGGVSVGVTSTIVVQGDASERTLMLIEGALAQQKRELPNDIIKTVQQMQSRRMT